MKSAFVVSVAILGLARAPAPQAVGVAGLYSDMRFIEDEGDYVGTEVFIVPSMEDGTLRHFALVQFAEGVPSRPQLVEVSVDEYRVEFTASFLGAREVRFRGEVSPESLTGRFLELDTDVVLPRGESLWQ